MNFRNCARKHVDAARELAAIGDGKGLRAACLELRMAIEALTYENLRVYLLEVNGSAMEKWQPRKVIDELLYIDPRADQSAHIAFGIEEEYGQPAKEMQSLGTDHRFTVKWANKAHNALGSYPHEPTIAQHKAGKAAQDEKMQAKIEEVLVELQPILTSPIWGANLGEFVSFDCECEFTIKRKKPFFEDGKELSCADCGRLYDYQLENETWHAYLSTVPFDCPGESCDERHTIGRHEAKPGFEMQCSNCGSTLTFRNQLMVGVKASPTDSEVN